MADERVISIVMPAHNEEKTIATAVASVLDQRPAAARVEVIVVDDGSSDSTPERAAEAGARVIVRSGGGGSPAAARNLGAAVATGDPVVFLDADCVVRPGWLDAILAAHGRGADVVGGSLALPAGLPAIARCDYYCGWYLIHPERRAGAVPHHPPPNLSVRRDAFRATSGFSERPPLEYTNEEREWQGEVRRRGGTIWFEPRAVADHHNRPGLANLLRRNYRWGYTALEAKSQSGAARLAWLWRRPLLLVVGALPLALAHTTLIVACWLRARRFEILLMAPLVLLSRFAWVLGMCVGGVRWMLRGEASGAAPPPSPRWR
jgi:glycosyltransferase involved in cell wall biosynthesis